MYKPNEKKWIILLLFITVTLVMQCAKKEKTTEIVMPPMAEKLDKALTIHGHTRVDPYYWLNERDNPKVIDYLKAENAYTKDIMKHTEKLQEKLFKEIVGRIKQDDESVPYLSNGYYYYHRYEKKKEHPIYARKKGNLDADEEILLNVNKMAKGYDYYYVRGLSVSEDNQLLAFGVDTLSRRKYTIHFKNLVTGEILEDKIGNTTGSTVWANDNKTIFYVDKDSTLRPHKIFRHILGSPVKNDVEIYHEVDNTFDTWIEKSKSRKFIFIHSSSTLSDESRFLEADNPYGAFKVIQKRQRNHEYDVWHHEDSFYFITNYKAKNFRVMKTLITKSEKRHWKEVIPHRDQVLVEGLDVFKNFLVVSERKNGLTQLKVMNLKDRSEHYIDFDEEAFLVETFKNREFNTNLVRYDYTSMTTPFTTYDYNMDTREAELKKQDEVLGDFDSNNYQTERIFAKAKDGIKVPISLVYRKGLDKNGDNPLVLYGYGSYGASMDPYFRSDRLSLLDRGFIYAIAHIRGGEEMGRYWYEQGKMKNKKNTFTDFIACAEHLISQGYTNPEKLYASGGSAGGLLMGAITNMRPELFDGIIARVPFMDVITTMLDETIPLTTGEFDEWGNPKIKDQYEYILSYSPYDNLEAKDYPNILVTAGLHDSQVQYFEPAKYVAKLRTLKTDNNWLLLHTQMEAGHSGASGRFERYKTRALQYAFLLDLAGIKK